jgi:hypothetical protein
LSGDIIRFTLVNLATGATRPEGFATTGSHGMATGGARVPAGRYAMIAEWAPRGGATLQTRQGFTSH